MSEKRLSILVAKGLTVFYGNKSVLNNVSFDVDQEEIVAVIGHNGAGKSTLLKSLFGIVPLREGTVEVDGQFIAAPTPRSLLQQGISFVPQGNRVFGELTVRENLEVGGVTVSSKSILNERIDQMFSAFPVLKSRLWQKAATLSGGEKQMLALANSMILKPRLLLLDEPSLGLSPRAASEVLEYISRICRENRVSILIVEQKVREVLTVAHRVLALRNGIVSFWGAADQLKDDASLRRVYF